MIRPVSRAALAALITLSIAAGTVAAHDAHALASVTDLDADVELVDGGLGNQTDPHLTGSLVVYTHADGTQSRVRYRDLATGETDIVPNGGEIKIDALPDADGDLIVFRRVDGSATRRVMFFDRSQAELGVRELAPQPDVRRSLPRIGGTTVAFQDERTFSASRTDVCVADVAAPLAPAVCLSSDGAEMTNRDADVSADGTAVVWSKCSTFGTGCDVFAARRQAVGSWGPSVQLTATGDGVEEIHPDTDGAIVTWASNVAGGPDFDIWWKHLDGGEAHRLVMLDLPGSLEYAPTIADGVIAFERKPTSSGSNADLYLYRIATDELFRVRETPDVNETLSTISSVGDDRFHVAWAAPDALNLGHNDVFATTVELSSATYELCLLYDPTKAHRAGGTVPLKVQLCDEAGVNLSSPETPLTVVGLVKRDASASTDFAESPGNANSDSAFRYDEELAGYIFNLSTRGLSTGTWELRFTVADDGTVYALPFDIR